MVPYGPLLRVRATLESERRRMLQARGVLTLAEDENTILAEASGIFLPLPDTVLKASPAALRFLDASEQRASIPSGPGKGENGQAG